MADCIDALIDADLITTLRTIEIGDDYNTDIGTVERLRSIQNINDRFPYTLVIPMEPDDIEEYSFRDDKLNYMLWYFDGINDEGETADTEFTYRMRNVHADIIKALKTDVSRGGYAQMTSIPRHGFGWFDDGGTISLPGAWCLIEIDRIVNTDNPYQLG